MLNSGQGKNMQKTHANRKKLHGIGVRMETSFKEVTGWTCIAKRHVCIINTNYNQTAIFRSI